MARPEEQDLDFDPTVVREKAEPGRGDGSTNPGMVEPDTLDEPEVPGRYEVVRALGKGSMGEVLLVRDSRIGRDVAMKVILPEHRGEPGVRARFLREARVQGQLEHPSIVPVYDLGAGEHEASFFIMKRLRGMNLKQVIAGLYAGDPEIQRQFTRRRLLTAFSQVCLAVDFAHARGVIHRDLKPSNVMLGDFGEVYVLDWGIAKLRGRGIGAKPGLPGGAPIVDQSGEEASLGVVVSGTEEVKTASGKILGTFGYMSPEQAMGKVGELDPRSDVYALGAVLFELLTLTPLHEKDTWNAMLFATLKGVSARPSERAPAADVPPELEAICVKATALAPKDRYQTARELHEAVERFLDGDRDLERRRAMAEAHARAAEEAVARAVAGGEGAVEARRRALHEVGRTLALDPDNAAAMKILTDLVTKPPREVPRAVTDEVDALTAARHRIQLRDGIVADFAGLSLMVPFVLWMGLRSPGLLAAAILLTFLSTAFKVVALRMIGGARLRIREAYLCAYGAYLFNALSLVCISRGFGPLLFTPVLFAVFTFAYCTTSNARFRLAVMGTGSLAIVVPWLLERAGVLARSYAFDGGVMTILPNAVSFGDLSTSLGLAIAAVFLVAFPGVLVGRTHDTLRAAEERSTLTTWHLRQLLPDEAHAPVRA